MVRRALLEGILVAAAAVAAQASGLFGDAVFDDGIGVLENPRVEDAGRLLRYARDPADRDGQGASLPNYAYRPLTELSFLLVREVLGPGIVVQRAVNLGLHAAAAWLVLALARRLCGGGAGAILAGLAFAVHPLGVQAVTYVYQRHTCLQALLGFACLLSYLRAREGGGGMAAALAFAALGALAKETAVTLPLQLAFLEWVLRRGETTGTVLRRLAPFAFVACLVPVQVCRAMRGTGPLGWEGVRPGLDAVSYLRAQGGVVWSYLATHLLPFSLHFYHDPASAPDPSPVAWLPTAGIALLAAWAAFGPARWRAPRLGLGLLLAPLALESSVFPIRDTAFLHRCYPGLLGGALLAAWALGPHRRIAAAVLAWLACATATEGPRWRDQETLLMRDIRHAPHQERLRARHAWDLLRRGRPERAMRTASLAIRCVPPGPFSRIVHALAIEASGDPRGALREILQAPDEGQTRATRLAEAVRLARLCGEDAKVAGLAAAAAALPPPSRTAGLKLAAELASAGRSAEAERVLRRTLGNASRTPELWDELGVLLTGRGRPGEAEAAHRRAIACGPLASAHNNLGALLAAQGRLEEAEAEIREALRLEPAYAMGWRNLALLLRAVGREAEARAAEARCAACPPDRRLDRPPQP